MATDYFVTNPATGGAIFRALNDGTVLWPACVVTYATTIGDPDTLQVVDAAHPLPVTAAALPLPAGAATQATLASIDGKVTAVNTGAVVIASGTISLPSGASTAANQTTEIGYLATLAAAAGSVAVSNFPSGFLSAQSGAWTVTANGPLTDTQLRATAVPVSGSLTVSGTVTATGPLTDTQLRATAVPVSLASVPSHQVTNAGTFAVQAACVLGAETSKVIGTVNVSAGQAIAVTNAGTFATQATLAAETTKVIGTVNIASAQTIAVVTSITNELPAGTQLLGSIAARCSTSAVMNGTTALTPKFANVSAAASGDNALVALVAGKKIRVLAMSLLCAGTSVSLYLSSSAAAGTKLFADGTNKVKLDSTGATGAGGFVLPFNPLGWFETVAGEALNLNLSAAQAVVGSVCYVEV